MQLILGIHCHQPLGNFDDVVDEACDRAYLPFLEVMARHPALPFNIHYSGSLLEWLEGHRPDVLELLAEQGDRLEWMSGGFYEPVLPVIPAADRVAQIKLLSDHLERRFGQRPRGIWLTERVWDPSLPASLAEAGVEYVPVDDFHFLAAGYPAGALTGRFVTDHLGATVSLFPISQRLRYTIPFEEPEVTIEELRALHRRDPDALAVMVDDGEKFGVWPGTHEWVYGDEGWLERFLTAVEAEGEWLEVTTFQRYLETGPPPRGRVAVPPASYFEMTEWALPAPSGRRFTELVARLQEEGLWEEAKPFVRGGYWPHFQVEYPESNVMYRKMLRLSRALSRSRKAPEEARRDLLRGQQNCPYWHGIFGGLYLPHLRREVHGRLITGRRALDGARHRGRRWTELEVVDWDADGEEEVAVELAEQSWVLDPTEGGALLYFDDKPSAWAVADVLARRFEAYHPSLQAGTAGSVLEGDHATIHDRPATGDKPPIEEFVYDPHPRRWLIDHLLPEEVGPESFRDVRYREVLPLPRLRFSWRAEGGRGRARITLEGAPGKGMRIEKEVLARGRSLQVTYHLEGLPEGRFGPELPVAVWEGAGHLAAGRGEGQPIDGPLAVSGRRFVFRHEGLGTRLVLRLDPSGEVFCFPLRTISKSEADYDDIMQGVVLWPHWRHQAGEPSRYRLRVEVEDA